MSSSRRRIAGSVIGGVLGAAATGAAVGAAARWSSLARERRKPHEEPAERGMLPAGVEWSVTADDDVRLSAEVIEPADGKKAALTVVLVHGFALDRRCWHFQRKTLAGLTGPNVRLVLYDQRGHGRSERASRESAAIAQLGADLQAVLRTLAPEGPVVLVGHSMGGMTIMALAESEPDLFVDRIVGVALLCTSAGEFAGQGLPGTFLSRRNPLTRTVGTLARLQPRFVERVRKMINDVVWGVTRAYAYGDRAVDHWLVDFVHEMISANGVDALINFVDTLNTHDRVAALPALSKCDTLVLAGGGDRLIPARHSEVIAAELPGATLIELPGVGHMAMLEQPDVVNEALVALVTRVGRPNGVVRRLRKRA